MSSSSVSAEDEQTIATSDAPQAGGKAGSFLAATNEHAVPRELAPDTKVAFDVDAGGKQVESPPSA